MSEGGREQGREGNFKGGTMRRTLASIQCTKQPTTRPLPLIICYYKLMKNSEKVNKLCIVMHHNVLFDRWMTLFYVMAIMDLVHMGWTWCI